MKFETRNFDELKLWELKEKFEPLLEMIPDLKKC